MTPSRRDLFPWILGAGLAASLIAMVGLVITRHPGWALVTAVAALAFGLPFTGWLIAWPYLQADIVLRVIANGGSIARHDLTDYSSPAHDALFRVLEKRQILVQQNGMLYLDPSRIRPVLAFFIRLTLRSFRSRSTR